MTRDEIFVKIKEDMKSKVKTWDDLYTMFDYTMARVLENPNEQTMMDSMISMYAFFKAMQELPDEGDISVLIEKMVRNIVLDSTEKLGVETHVVMAEEAKDIMKKRLQAVEIARAFDGLTIGVGGKPHIH